MSAMFCKLTDPDSKPSPRSCWRARFPLIRLSPHGASPASFLQGLPEG